MGHHGQPRVPGPGGYPSGQPPVPNHLVWSILATLFCCLPFGIVAIVYSSQVSSKLQAGDFAGAQASSRSAKTWCWVAFGVGLGVQALFLIFTVAAGVMSQPH
jgi:hypothetical protein